MEPNYIDIQKTISYAVRRVVTEIEQGYSPESINEYLDKYDCKNTTELVYLLLCEVKPSDLNISLNMRQKIKNISDEINENESEDEHLSSTITNLINEKNELSEKVDSLKEMFIIKNKEIEDMKIKYTNLELKLKSQSVSKNDLG